MCAMPSSWQKKYSLLFLLPQKEEELLHNLEKIEVADEAEKSSEKGAGKNKKGKKQNRVMQMPGCIPKKARSKKFCQLCKTHGGMHLMHNMSECHKYGKDSIAKGLADKKRNPNKKGRSWDGTLPNLQVNLRKSKERSIMFPVGRKET